MVTNSQGNACPTAVVRSCGRDIQGRRPLGRVRRTEPSQSEALALVIQGPWTHEIPGELDLGVNPVKTYIHHAYPRIDAANRVQAVSWAVQHGFPLLDPTDD